MPELRNEEPHHHTMLQAARSEEHADMPILQRMALGVPVPKQGEKPEDSEGDSATGKDPERTFPDG